MAASEQKAYEAIRHAILTGDYESGMHLRAAGLAEAIGVSRTPVREALSRLHAEGLVEFFEHRGAFVAGWSRDDAEEVFDLRLVLECHAANRAALRLTPDEIDRLVELTDLMERHSAGAERDIALVTDANNRFHGIIIEAAANRRLSAIISSVVELALVSRTFSFYSDLAFSRSIAHHREMIEAFRNRDPLWAAGVMNNHLRAAHHVFASAVNSEG